MPLVRIDALGTAGERLDALGRAVHDAWVETMGAPPDDRFQVLVGHEGSSSDSGVGAGVGWTPTTSRWGRPAGSW